MATRTEFRLTGSGGQGLITAGIILAEACILDGKKAIQTQSYGPEARGGSSKAEVIVSDSEIYYPKAVEPQYVLCLTTEAFEKFGRSSVGKGTIIADTTVDTGDATGVIKVPVLKTAAEELKPIVANVISLGFLGTFSGVVSKDAMKEALLARVPKGTEALNEKALEKGIEMAMAART